MLKAYKYRIYPTTKQQEMLAKNFGCCRFIYNLGLETKIKAYETTGKSLSYFDLQNGMLKDLKKEHLWLKEPYSQCLQMALRNLDNAFTRFFREKKGFPKFKSKHKSISSCQYPQNVFIDFQKNTILVPKIGNIKTVLSRDFQGKIKTTTVSKTKTNKYFVSILVDNGMEQPEKEKIKELTTIGIDLGLKEFLITSNGDKVENPRYLRTNIQKLKILQRRFSKKKKGSTKRNKARLNVNKLYEKISNQRKDFLHKSSSKIIRENQTICLEDLNIKGMMKNNKLARSIQDVSWSQFVDYLKYKAEWYGKNIIQIGRFESSSKTCSNCGTIYKGLKLEERNWICNSCHASHDRDVNAAINIKKFGLIGISKSNPLKYSGPEQPGEPVEMSVNNPESVKRLGIPSLYGRVSSMIKLNIGHKVTNISKD